MQEIFYKRVGRRYVPVYVYDSKVMDGMPIGTHLVVITKNGGSYRYNVDPALAPLLAAGYYAEESMRSAVQEASALRLKSSPITPEQQAAWKQLEKAFGDDKYVLQTASSHDVARAGVTALEQEATRLMSNPAVKEAYDQFMLICKLAQMEQE